MRTQAVITRFGATSIRGAALAAALALGACKHDADSDTDVDTDTDVVDTDAIASDMPADPRPITVTATGAYEGTLVFDAPKCTVQGGNFRVFWRNAESTHVFVLIGETLGHYTGPGDYGSDLSNTRAKLQEEAGGSGNFFQTDTTQGDSFTMTVTHVDDPLFGSKAWGSFTVNGLHGDLGAVSIAPNTIPIWCEHYN